MESQSASFEKRQNEERAPFDVVIVQGLRNEPALPPPPPPPPPPLTLRVDIFDAVPFEVLEMAFEVQLRLHFHLKMNEFSPFEVFEIAFEVQLRLHFHLKLNDFVQFEVLEIAFEVPLRLQIY